MNQKQIEFLKNMAIFPGISEREKISHVSSQLRTSLEEAAKLLNLYKPQSTTYFLSQEDWGRKLSDLNHKDPQELLKTTPFYWSGLDRYGSHQLLRNYAKEGTFLARPSQDQKPGETKVTIDVIKDLQGDINSFKLTLITEEMNPEAVEDSGPYWHVSSEYGWAFGQRRPRTLEGFVANFPEIFRFPLAN